MNISQSNSDNDYYSPSSSDEYYSPLNITNLYTDILESNKEIFLFYIFVYNNIIDCFELIHHKELII